MGLRPAKCYTPTKRPWTRQSRKKPKKGYVKGVPVNKIHKFQDGNTTKKFALCASLVAKTDFQIRNNALEAARVSTIKEMQEIGPENYFIKILVYPHHVMRENAMATGAGADRFQTGMRKAFGKPAGTAVQVRSNQPVISTFVQKGKEKEARHALKVAASKMPGTFRVEVNEVN